MREIKFRFYSKDAKQYAPIESIDLKGNFFTVRYLGSNHHIDGISQLEQYTGLKDKNGKEIYEGDIVNKQYRKMKTFNYNGTVIMGYICDSDGYEAGSTYGWIAGDSSLSDLINDCEVIGNIHENPELL